ncbi:hypothetical protein [Helicobacter sp.]|nr:hypothetical protein [Helicobacter sp.]
MRNVILMDCFHAPSKDAVGNVIVSKFAKLAWQSIVMHFKGIKQ